MHKIKYHLSKAQQNLVDKISKYYKLYTTAKVKETNAVVIKAPTAAGKTVLIANIANHIAKEDKQAVFIVVTIPKNTLHLAAKSSITDSIEKFGLSYLDNPITVDKNTDIDKVLKRVLHPELGKASCITTADNYFNELNKCKINYDVFSDLLDKLKEHGKSIYCFVDEAHYNFQKAQSLLSSNSNLIFYVSATPDTLANQYKLSDSKNYFEITKQEAIEDNLLVEAIDNTDFDDVLIGNSKLCGCDIDTDLHLSINGKHVASVVINDGIKENAKETISKLKNSNIKTYMFTGDKKAVALNIGKKLGLDEIKYEMLPQDKFKAFEKVSGNSEVTIFVGDGINDAPVLRRADIGISMGGVGSDSAIEASDIVLMSDELSRIPLAINISKYTKRIIKENLIFAMSVKVVILLLSVFGYANMWLAVFADTGVTLLTILNTLRIMNKFKEEN